MPSGIIEISDYYLSQVKKVLAYPNVDQILLTDEQIKLYAIAPATVDYFSKFPIESTTEHSVSTSTENDIDFPDSTTFGVTDARLVGKMTTWGTGSSFWDLVYYNTMFEGSNNSGSYGIWGYNPGFKRQQTSFKKQAIASRANEATLDIRINNVNRKVTLFTNISGKANVTWAKYSENFDDIKYVYLNDVIELAQSYLKEHLADTTGIITKNLEIDIDSDKLKSEALELKRKIMDKWAEIPSIHVIRQ
jgi:hypothetical protein